MKKIALFTSGGDAPGMNACIRAIVRTALHYNVQVLGIKRGYEGMIEGDFEELLARSVGNIIQRGGTILKTARSIEFFSPEGRKKAFEQINNAKIEGIIAIGGDGTFKGANVFTSEYGIPFIGIPGTIDNDMFGTDFTIGYDTAINTVLSAIDKIRDTADAHDRLFFVEVMGRDAGHIALLSGMAGGAEAVLIPESITNIDILAQNIKNGWELGKKSSIVIVAEGDEAGGAFKIADLVKARLDKKFDIRVTILGHIQRGGSPSCMDRVLATRLGVAAVKALLSGKVNEMVGTINNEIVFTPFSNAVKINSEINGGHLQKITEYLEIVEMLSQQ